MSEEPEDGAGLDDLVSTGTGSDAEATGLASTYKVLGELDEAGGAGVLGENSAASNNATGVEGYASATGVTAATYGVRGVSEADAQAKSGTTRAIPAGVRGRTTGAGSTHAVEGLAESTGGRGVFGMAMDDPSELNEPSNIPVGVFGITDRTNADQGIAGGYGVAGIGFATSGTNFGVYGGTNSPDGYGVYGHDRSGTGSAYGVVSEGDSKTMGNHEVTGSIAVDGSQYVGSLGASAYRSTTQTIDSGSFQTVVFDATEADDRGEFDTNTGTFTCATNGDYRVSTGVMWADLLSGGTAYRLAVTVDGDDRVRRYQEVDGSSANSSKVTMHVARTLRGLSAGDTIAVQVYQDSGSTKDLDPSSADTWLTVEKIG